MDVGRNDNSGKPRGLAFGKAKLASSSCIAIIKAFLSVFVSPRTVNDIEPLKHSSDSHVLGTKDFG